MSKKLGLVVGVGIALVLALIACDSRSGSREGGEVAPPPQEAQVARTIGWRGEYTGYRSRTRIYENGAWEDLPSEQVRPVYESLEHNLGEEATGK